MYPSCRVCMTSSGVLVNIFTKERETFPSLEFMINECVEVKVTRMDKLPKHICKVCLSDVHAAFRFKRNYELTLKQLNKKLDVKETKRKEAFDISGEENNTQDVITCEPKPTFGKKRKRTIAIKARRKVLISKKMKPKKKESKSERESYLNEESKNEESHNDIKPDLEKASDESESEKNEPEREPSDQPLSESPSVDEDEPKTKNKKMRMKPKKTYLCNLCDKVLKSNSHLAMHALVHSGEYPHECEHCQAKFRYKWNLKRHVDKNVLCQGPYKRKDYEETKIHRDF